MTTLETTQSGPVPAAEIAIPRCLTALFFQLEQQRVSYCYWKSSRRIWSALSGASDVDLLVAPSDLHRFELILLAQDFRRFSTLAHRDHPSIVSFLGFDETAGRLIHLHVHYRLILGEPLFKNYHVPWEREILARSVIDPVFQVRTLDAVSEALLLAVRRSIELSRLDPVSLRSWRSVEEKFALDQENLSERVDRLALCALSGKLLGEDAANLPGDIVFAARSSLRAAAAARQLKRRLAPYRTYNGPEARIRALSRAAAWAAGAVNKRYLHLPRPWSRRPPGGGRVVSLIGVDGSGKSTAVATLTSWLASELDVMPVYFGTGDGRPSLLLLPLKLLLPLASLLIGTKPKGSSHGRVSDQQPGRLYSVLLMVWATVLAMEKRKKLLSAHRGADRGLFVLTDRYPQDEIAEFNDGPLLPRLNNVPKWLRGFETRAYALARRLPPDLVLKLVVSHATAARREPDMSPAVIEQRLVGVTNLKFAGAKVVSIDAQQPLETVSLALKREVWRIL